MKPVKMFYNLSGSAKGQKSQETIHAHGHMFECGTNNLITNQWKQPNDKSNVSVVTQLDSIQQ